MSEIAQAHIDAEQGIPTPTLGVLESRYARLRAHAQMLIGSLGAPSSAQRWQA